MQDYDRNPYAPPTFGPQMGVAPYMPYGGSYYDAGTYALSASRGARLGAKIIDGLLTMAVGIPGFIWLVSATSTDYTRGDDMVGPLLLTFGPILAFVIYQWVMIAKRGQTLGKRALDIKIVRENGAPVDFVCGVILREWVLGLAGGVPYVGSCVGLIDALWIFGQDSQCLHDKIAKTRVVNCTPASF